MLGRIRRKLRQLKCNTSGNATMMVALGVPALVGGSGLAVDVAQWYMWKRELQYAVDQSALAGAYAMVHDETQDEFEARALQEFNNNIAQAADNATDPNIRLMDYNGGADNSVQVTSSVTDRLPFSSFMTGQSTTVTATAQAAFNEGEQFTACIVAVDRHADGSVTIGGTASLTARCGIAALSDSDQAIVINGNPEVDAGWVVARGGIDDWMDQYTDAEIHEGVEDLVDPFESLTPPNDPRPREYGCSKATTTTTTTGTETTTITTATYQGNSKTKMTLISTVTGSPVTTEVNRPAAKGETTGTSTSTSTNSSWRDAGSRASPRYTRTDTTTVVDKNITVTTTESPSIANLQPGTYTSLHLSCDTVFQPGIYVLDGGELRTNAQYTVTGNGVMFVLKNGAGFTINGGANVTFTAMQTAQLLSAYSVPAITEENASQLSGMLIFEDRESPGNNNGNVMNGNAATVLNGTIYLPRSEIRINGTATVTSQCLMIAAAQVTLLGGADLSTFCPPGLVDDTVVSEGRPSVRLVA